MASGLPEVTLASEGEKRQAVRRALSGIRDYRIRDVIAHILFHCTDATVHAQNGKREVSYSKAVTLPPGHQQQLRSFLAGLRSHERESLQSILPSHPWGLAVHDVLKGIEIPPPPSQEGPTQEELRARFVRSLKRQRFPLPLQRAIEALVPDCTFTPARGDDVTCTFHGHYSLEAAQEASRQLQKIGDSTEILNLSLKGVPPTVVNQLLTLYIGDVRTLLRTEDLDHYNALQRDFVFTIDTVIPPVEEELQRVPETPIHDAPEDAFSPPLPTETIPPPRHRERKPKPPKKRKEKRTPALTVQIDQPPVPNFPFPTLAEPARVPEPQQEVSPELQVAASQWSTIVQYLHQKKLWTLREADNILAAGGTELTDKGNHWNVEGPRGRGTLPSAGVKDRALLNNTVQKLLQKTANLPQVYEWITQQAG